MSSGSMRAAFFLSSWNIQSPRLYRSIANSAVICGNCSSSPHSYVASHPSAGDLHILRPALSSGDTIKHHSRGYATKLAGRKSTTHYYDVLGLSPKATQNQIKTAYYKMSKVHHPDVTECSKSHSLFTEINEAYEVLGNLRKRRMYDKGVYNPQDRRNHEPAGDEEEDYTKAYKQSSNFERGNRPPPPTGRTRVYNFDEYYRQHYNDLRERRANEFREYVRYKEMLDEHSKHRTKELPMSVLSTGLLIFLFFVTVKLLSPNYDTDHIQKIRRQAALASNGRYDPTANISSPEMQTKQD